MKVFSIIVKIVAALAFIAGAVYLIATYGDKIVAWSKKLLSCKCCGCDAEVEVEITDDEAEEAPAEEVVEEVAAEDAPVAEEKDFEG